MAASTGAANSKPTDAIPTSNARHCDDHLACTAQVQDGFQLLVAVEQPARRARAGSSRRRARADRAASRHVWGARVRINT